MSLTYLGFRLASATVPALPRPVVRALGVAAGSLGWMVGRDARGAVRANLSIVLGRAPRNQEVLSVFLTQAANYCDLVWLPRLSTVDLEKRVQVEGIEHLKAALAGGRGAIVGSLHLGNLEVVGYAAVQSGMPIMLPVERVDPPELLDLMIRLRQRAGLTCEPVGRDAFDRIRRALRENSIVGVGVDRITLGEGDVVDFCGRPARLPVAAALLSLRTGAPLLPIGSSREPGDRYRVRIGSPVHIVRTGSLRHDVRTLSELLLVKLRVYLEESPTQWVVFRRIWDVETTS